MYTYFSSSAIMKFVCGTLLIIMTPLFGAKFIHYGYGWSFHIDFNLKLVFLSWCI